MKSIHFVGEWFDCRAPRIALTDPDLIQARCMEHITRRHLPITYGHFTLDTKGGVIGAMTGHQLHIVLRTYPCRDAVMADLFVDQGAPPEIAAAMRVFDGLRDEFRPMRALLHRVQADGRSLPTQGRTPVAPTEVFSLRQVRRAV